MYEQSVQTPDVHAKWFVDVYKQLRNAYPRHLREDFCGTFRISCAWVSRNTRNTAVGLDLDPTPLDYGRRHHAKGLTTDQRRRLTVLRQDVISLTTPKADVIAACNFSFYVFHERRTLVDYFRCCRRSLAPNGLLVLEMAGGPGFTEPMRERRTIQAKGKRLFTYVWDQQSFDPIHQHAQYAIHFYLPDGRRIRNAFTYDWRIWTIPEVREALAEAGFADTHVYWETEHKGKGTGEFIKSDSADNAYAWIAYVVGA